MPLNNFQNVVTNKEWLWECDACYHLLRYGEVFSMTHIKCLTNDWVTPIGKYSFGDQLFFYSIFSFSKNMHPFCKGNVPCPLRNQLHNQDTKSNKNMHKQRLGCTCRPPWSVLSRSVWSSNIHYIFPSHGLFNIQQSAGQRDAYIFPHCTFGSNYTNPCSLWGLP